MTNFFVLLLLSFSLQNLHAAEFDDLELIDKSDVKLLQDNSDTSSLLDDLSFVQEEDDLNSLKIDLGVDINKIENSNDESIGNKNEKNKKQDESIIAIKPEQQKFDLGDEEKKLLKLLPLIGKRIPEEEWNEIAKKQNITSYKIEKGDTLWSVSKRFFGTGFYYSKIWSLNPYIENPHQIEPGMTLIFSSGSSSGLPEVQVGRFKSNKLSDKNVEFAFESFGDNVRPKWIDEREQLLAQGNYFVYGSNQTYNDIKKLGSKTINYEYQKYEPPVNEQKVIVPDVHYDNDGFDSNDKIVFKLKTGFSINTFITSNIVQDFGEIVGLQSENVIIRQNNHIYIKFDPSVKVKPGDMFSVYIPHGKVESKHSDRTGYRYTIGANIKIIGQKENKWEAVVKDLITEIRRGDRITILTPKIPSIKKTYNKRKIDASIVGFFKGESKLGAYQGDIVYLDRGRLDGIEFGNVVKFYGFKDHGVNRIITRTPTYETGEAVIITVTDNFSTAIVEQSSREALEGALAQTQTLDEYLLSKNLRTGKNNYNIKLKKESQLENLDLELNLADINKDLLEKADQIKLTDDELAELDKQEREKSIIAGQENDLEELNKIESELLKAKNDIDESILDEDKYLEQQNLDQIEKTADGKGVNALESMDDLENEIGKKYLDEDINAEENPYGLTKFDLEDIDELLQKQ